MIQDIQPTLFRDVERTPRIPSDITARKHKGNSASVAANPTAEAKRAMHRTIYAFVSFRGKSYLKEIARELGKQPHAISGRISEMLAMKPPMLERVKGERVEGCGMLRACK